MTVAVASQAVNIPAPERDWQAKLELSMIARTDKTVMNHRRHVGPLRVQRPFYPEDDGCCHVYVLHPPGGLVGGDQLLVEVDLADNARSLLTTPGAGKVYRCNGFASSLTQNITLAHDTSLEWFPQENIIFDGANGQQVTRVQLSGNAHFMGWDICCFGRPAANALFNTGQYQQQFLLYRDDKPLMLEKLFVDGESEMMQAGWGLAGCTVSGSFYCVTDNTNLITSVRDVIAAYSQVAAATYLDGVLVVRYLGHSAEQAKQIFTLAWTALRPRVLNKKASPPRIWLT